MSKDGKPAQCVKKGKSSKQDMIEWTYSRK